MKKEFLINIVLLVAINFLIKPLYLFGVETEAQNIVGISEWGKYYELFNFCFLFGFIHNPGLLSYNSKTISENPSLLKFMFSPVLGSKLILGLAFFIISIIGFVVLGYDKTWSTILILIALCQFLGSVYLLLRSNVSGIGEYRYDSFFSALDKLLMLIIVSVMVFTPALGRDFTITHLVSGQCMALSLAITIVYTFLYKRKKVGLPTFSMLYVKNLLSQTLPFGILMIVMVMYSKIDGVMLGRLLDDNNHQVGIYGACYRIIDALSMIGNIFGALLVSMFASLIGKKKSVNGLLEVALRVLSVISISAFVIIGLYRHSILDALYDDYTTYFSQVLLVLLGGFVFLSLAYIIGALLTANGNLKSMNKLFIGGLVINIIMNVFLIPSYQAYGAGVATLITEFLMLVGLFVIAHKEVNIRFARKFYQQACLFILGALLCSFVISLIDIPWVIGFIILGLSMVVLSFISGMLSMGDIKQLLRK